MFSPLKIKPPRIPILRGFVPLLPGQLRNAVACAPPTLHLLSRTHTPSGSCVPRTAMLVTRTEQITKKSKTKAKKKKKTKRRRKKKKKKKKRKRRRRATCAGPGRDGCALSEDER